MNIAEAKEEIKRAAAVYLRKDSTGGYVFPAAGQRPVLLMGPPGIGKSAVAAQAAEEAGIGFVSYSLTHHTRQSAIGLPHITEQSFGGKMMQATEYTMSEIIAAVYQTIEKNDCPEGILFIDEINCVSDTLTPVMLQFLQTKTFGTHRVPEGWMIVAAGNPPAYNRSAKELDIVTLDRVRTIEIEPDSEAWLQYAGQRGVHHAIISYLRLHPDHFYRASSDALQKTFVTPRGWEDLSMLLLAYEEMGWQADIRQIREYIHEDKTAGSFAAYYEIYTRYGEDYPVQDLLEGRLTANEWEPLQKRVQDAGLEERLTVIGLLISALERTLQNEGRSRRGLRVIQEYSDKVRIRLLQNQSLEELADQTELAREIQQGSAAASQPADTAYTAAAPSSRSEEAYAFRLLILTMRRADRDMRMQGRIDPAYGVNLWHAEEEHLRNTLEMCAAETGRQLEILLTFSEGAFPYEEDRFFILTALSQNRELMHHVAEYGSKTFLRWAEALGLS